MPPQLILPPTREEAARLRPPAPAPGATIATILRAALPGIALAIAGRTGRAGGGALLSQFGTAGREGLLLEQALAAQQQAAADRAATRQRQLAELDLRRASHDLETERAAQQQALELLEFRQNLIRQVRAEPDPAIGQQLFEDANRTLSNLGLQFALPPDLFESRARTHVSELATKTVDEFARTDYGERLIASVLDPTDPDHETARDTTLVVSSALLRALPADQRVGTNRARLSDLLITAGRAGVNAEGLPIPLPLTEADRHLIQVAQDAGLAVSSKADLARLPIRTRKRLERQLKEWERLPPQPPAIEPVVIMPTVGPAGEEVREVLPQSEALARRRFPQPRPTALLQAEEARERLLPAMEMVETLSYRIIQRIGPAQRADAVKRGIEATFGHDPDFRTYQDARWPVAASLAKLYDPRPSDLDIQRVWVPLIPSPYEDTAESMASKWQLIRMMAGVTQTPTQTPTQNPFRSP